MKPIPFAIVGGGWRADFYLRIAQALPEKFCVNAALIRDPEKAKVFQKKWGVPTYPTLDEVKSKAAPDFVVASVSWPSMPILIRETNERGMHILAETPPAPDLEGLLALYQSDLGKTKIQVAEQYFLQPFHAARLNLIATGKLGKVSEAQVSVAHGYHGVSLIRKYLGIGFEKATIRAMKFNSPIVQGPGRNGPPAAEKIKDSSQDLAWLDFGDRMGIFDFAGDQYFSWIRSLRVLLRGERGEINDKTVRYLEDYRTPIRGELIRQNAGEEGNLEGNYHKGFLFENRWIYKNPFAPASLNDDEIAVASCLQKMHEYTQGGESFYSLAEASHDHYLGMMISKAVEAGTPLVTTDQPWCRS